MSLASETNCKEGMVIIISVKAHRTYCQNSEEQFCLPESGKIIREDKIFELNLEG